MLTKELNINVVDAAERRIYEAFLKNKTIVMSFSGGKDSICMSDMVIRTMYETGKDLSHHYRETSTGGLAKLYGGK